MAWVGAAPDAIVADQAKSDGPINGPINMRVLHSFGSMPVANVRISQTGLVFR